MSVYIDNDVDLILDGLDEKNLGDRAIVHNQYHSPDGKLLLRIYKSLESDDGNPREDPGSCLANFCCLKESLGDPYKDSEFESFDDRIKHINKTSVVCVPLYVYEHGGISMSVGEFSDEWDSGQAGVAYITKEDVNVFGFEDKSIKELESLLVREVERYDLYLTGEVYNFTLFEKSVCSAGDTHLKEIESEYGVLGEEEGIKDILEHNKAVDWQDEHDYSQDIGR